MPELHLALLVAGFIATLAFNSWGVIAFLMNKIEGVRKDTDSMRKDMVTRQEYERDSQNTYNTLQSMRSEINSKFDLLFSALINGRQKNE